MIARLHEESAVPEVYQRFLDDLRREGFAGDIASDRANRVVLATDNSIYQRLPHAVLYPRDTADLQRLARLAAAAPYRDIVLAPRGGGTGTNGQSLTDGLMVDVSRHMNRILEIDIENRRARVQAGVVKDQLNAALRPHGLFFAPELSTSNRATIGGMISTDASGQGSCEYGKTRDHVLALDIVLLGGERLESRPVSDDELASRCERKGLVGEAYRTARDIIDTQREQIETTFPKLNRCLTGYDLAHLRNPDGRFDLNSVLCGSEGSLAFVSEATINLLPLPRHSTLVNVCYSDFMDALRDAKVLMSGDSRPTSIETVDDKVLRLAMEDFVWDSVAEFFPPAPVETTDSHQPAIDSAGTAAKPAAICGINLVEFNDDDPSRLAQRIATFTRHLDADTGVRRLGWTLAEGRDEITRVYAMRKRAVGLLGNSKGEKRPIPFVEDTAVPPEDLADYIAEFRALLDAHGLEYGMFGHVDAGVLHVRSAIDMKDPEQAVLIREISDQVVALTRKYRGLLWGEHGKGIRSEYSPEFFGELYPQLQRLKAAFDPCNQLNPGKIATPYTAEPPAAQSPDRPGTGHEGAAVRRHDPGLLAIDGVPIRAEFDRRIDSKTWQAHSAAVHCNGNGACYNYDPDDAMCPSWKATRQRIHSPKGRASLMREWLRLQGDAGADVLAESDKLRTERAGGFLLGLPRRLRNTLAHRRGRQDFSHEVYAAMAGCLGCKSCAAQCPVKVNVPEFRSQFLEIYHGRYLRPPRDYVVGGLEFFLPYLQPVAPFYNALLGAPMLSRLLAMTLGLVDSPGLSRTSLADRLKASGVAEATPALLASLSDEQRLHSVILVQDAFTSFFEAELVGEIIDLLKLLNFRVLIAPYAANGKPLHVQGFLGAFERTAARQAKHLASLSAFGVPLVGIDPPITLSYRQEYIKALGQEAVPRVLLLQEWLASLDADVFAQVRSPDEHGFSLLPHCTERTTAPEASKAWQTVFDRAGLKLEPMPAGCCGMSGNYGHERRNRATSEAIYDLSWRSKIESSAGAGRLLATGYSCRCQVRRFSGIALAHPAQTLLQVLRETEQSAHP